MPIPEAKINRDWIELPPTATVHDVQTRVPRDLRRIRWIVTPMSATEYAVFKVTDLIAFAVDVFHLDAPPASFLTAQLDELGEFLKTYTRTAVESSADWDTVREAWDERSDPPLVVLQNGRPIGILKSTMRGGTAGEPGWLELPPPPEPKAANGGSHAGPPVANGGKPTPPLTDTVLGSSPGTLGGDPTAPPQAAAKPPRQINVSFVPSEQKDKPLQVGTRYTLDFGVDAERLVTAIATTVLDDSRLFPVGVEEVELIVQLLSDDFRILTKAQNLIVPREGESLNRARFDIIPKQNGKGKIVAVFSKDGNALQEIELILNVGIESVAISDSIARGRPVQAAGALQRRGLTLRIEYVGSGFKVDFIGPDEGSSFMIPLQLQELELEIGEARRALKNIVDFVEKGDKVFQVGTTISGTAKNATLPQLAETGSLLFQAIFQHPGSGQPAKDFAKRLRELCKGESINIQIISQQMMLPWGILYLAEPPFDNKQIDPEMFLGLKHIIEHIPMEQSMDFPTNIASQPELTISLNLNQEIDKQMNFPLIKNQQKYWDQKKDKGGVTIITRTTGAGLLEALAKDSTPDQIAYFYCHAESKNIAEGGAKASVLQFGDKSVTLRDFMLRAPASIRLSGSPLVFINACESAELSPLFYNGFMPYFVDKGARGMIGTECPVPALFASEWAGKFFDDFLGGKPLGQIFLDLRRDYFFNHNNILGLLYAVYCDADTAITPGLA